MSRIYRKVCRNGYVVRDIEAAMAHWINVMGAGPNSISRTSRQTGCASGAGTRTRERALRWPVSGIWTGLIQPGNEAPSIYKERVEARHEGLQHMPYWTRDYRGF
jgi:hypothetical protein